ncbi:MAG: hypothetical protein QG614_173 [Patescibacteria group bacterium]|nr:hypothetical protein [Patescibacteria group bacterium]
MQELSKLFGSVDRVKLIRLFLSKQDEIFDVEELENVLKIKKEVLKSELSELEKSNLIIKSKEQFTVEIENNGKIKQDVKDYICYGLNKEFRFTETLSELMFDFKNSDLNNLEDRFKEIGRTKLLLVSGLFIQNDKSRADILCVAESIKEKTLAKTLSDINIETGLKLNILVLDLQEFEYRYKMYDRFLRDILDGESKVLINKIPYLHFK